MVHCGSSWFSTWVYICVCVCVWTECYTCCKCLDLFGNPGGDGTICSSEASGWTPAPHCPPYVSWWKTSDFHFLWGKAWAALCGPFDAVPNLYFAELFVPRTVCFDKVETFLLPLRRVPDLFPHLQLRPKRVFCWPLRTAGDRLRASPPSMWLSGCEALINGTACGWHFLSSSVS